MQQFPVDAPISRVKRALAALGFSIVREENHISLERPNPDGTRTTMTIPNHTTIKGSTLRTSISLARIPREDFLRAYEKA